MDLTTYAGIAALTVAGVGMLKKLFPGWTKGKEKVLGLAVPVLLGVAGKLVFPAFEDVSWMNHVIALFSAGLGSGLIHDKVVNGVMNNKAEKA